MMNYKAFLHVSFIKITVTNIIELTNLLVCFCFAVENQKLITKIKLLRMENKEMKSKLFYQIHLNLSF